LSKFSGPKTHLFAEAMGGYLAQFEAGELSGLRFCPSVKSEEFVGTFLAPSY